MFRIRFKMPQKKDPLIKILPVVRGRYLQNISLARHTWFGVGGNAEIMYIPEDAGDLAHFLRNKPHNVPVCLIGGGTTSIASFKHGHPVYFGSIGVGSNNITNDIAWGLTTSFTHAERLKTLHGCAFMTSQDKNETINVYPVGEEDDSLIKQVPKSELIGIITPRVEEMFEMVNGKLADHGLKDISSHRIVLTGGGSLLSGMREVAAMILDKQVRLGRPRSIANMLDISNYPVLQSPAFSSVIGLLLFVINYTERKPNKIISKPAGIEGGRFGRILNWLKQNF